jgi:glutaminyl-peptide cyclotransferase
MHKVAYLLVVASVLTAVVSGCGRREHAASLPAVPLTGFDGARALAEVNAFVALGPREAGSANALKAAEYLAGRLQSLGITAERQSFADTVSGGTATFHNVIGKISGTGQGRNHARIILCAHFDTKRGIPGFIGANDSGSGVGVLLELARILKAGWRGTPEIWLAFFDGEECRESYGPQDGLHGSRHLARQLIATGPASDVHAVILLDMVGDRDLTVTLPSNGDARLTALVLDAATAVGERAKFSLASGPILDDHQPFLDAGLPAVDLIDFFFGSAPGLNDYWHTTTDTSDKLSAESLRTIGRVVLHLLAEL